MNDTFAIFQLLIGVYLIYCAITGRGKLYENEYLKCSREQYVKTMRILAAITGVILTGSTALELAGVVPPASTVGWILWALGFLPILGMAVYSSRMTDREAARQGRKTSAAAKDAAPTHDPLRAAFVFDDDDEKENTTQNNG